MVWPLKKKGVNNNTVTSGHPTDVSTAHTNQHDTEATRVRPGKLYMLLLPLLLLLTVGASVAPVAGISKGWLYYRHNNIAYQAPGPQFPGNQQLRIWVGWRYGTNTILQLLRNVAPTQVSVRIRNQDVAKAGQIVPAVTIAWLLASAGTAALYGLVWLFSSCFHIASRKTSRKTTKTTKPRSPLISSLLWPLLGMIFGLGNIGLCIATYIILAVGTAIYTRRNLGNRVYIGWPSWCFYVGCAAGLFWLIISLLAFTEATKARRRRKHAMGAYKRNQMTGDLDERRAVPFNQGQKTMPYADGAHGTNGVAPHGTATSGAWTGNGNGTGAPMVHDNNAYDHQHGDIENGVGHNRDVATWSTVGANKGPNPVINERI